MTLIWNGKPNPLTESPWFARRSALLALVLLAALPVALLVLPWYQTVHGRGRALAFDPTKRVQSLVSPLEGRVKKWYVVEGCKVKAGDRIVELIDNDPQLERRLLDMEQNVISRVNAASGRIREIDARIESLATSQRLAIDIQRSLSKIEENRLIQFEQELIAARAAVAQTKPNYQRARELEKKGLMSQADLERTLREYETSEATLAAATSRVALGKESVAAARDNIEKVQADTSAIISTEKAVRKSAESELASSERELTQLQIQISRQKAQYVDAPCDGTVYRLLANSAGGGILVRAGERLAVIVPEISSKTAPIELTPESTPGIVVELTIDGNDLTLLKLGDRVRLQFEGWPAVQFAGWPSVAQGTFGGVVHLIDPTSDEKGDFRILVSPAPGETWPEESLLRQGVRGQGWIILDRVPLWWEIWRQLNGFPPIRKSDEEKSASSFGPLDKKR